MGHFAAALKSALDVVGWKQSDLARESKAVVQSKLSRYISTNELPKPSTLGQICKVFPEELQRDLMAAYLTDQIPPELGELVLVTSVQEGKLAEAKYRANKAAPGTILRRDLDIIERRALKDPNLAKALNFWAASLEGITPAPEYFDGETEDWSVREDPAVKEAERKLKAGKSEKRPKKSD